MSYFEFPHTRNYDGDLGWIIKNLEELKDRYNTFFEYNSIRFHDPIEWDIKTQYPANNMVYVPATGNLIISLKPVPIGIDYNNPEYWALVSPFKTDTEFSTTSRNPIANYMVTNKFNSLNLNVTDLNNRLNAEIEARINEDNQLNAELASVSGDLSDEVAARANADSVLSARIDAFEQLTPGSTTGDAELIDIRVGSNGITYDTAGDAVRGQYTELNNKIEPLEDYDFPALFKELDVIPDGNIYNSATATDNGYVAPNGNISSSPTYCYSAKIPVKVGKTYTFWALYQGAVTNANVRFICAYNANNEAVSGSGSSQSVDTYTVPANIESIVI